MPREDERFRNLSPRHPEYCTCVECVERRRNDGNGNANPLRAVGGLVGKLTGKGAKAGRADKAGKGKRRGQSGGSGKARGRSAVVGETVRKHKRNCECATCTLLKSI